MYYQKCYVCGHLNEVKSEYLVFCSQCNKKLDVNYSEWHARNSDKTFDDFKKLYCISTEAIQQASQSKKDKKTSGIPRWILVWGIVAIVVVPVSAYFIFKNVDFKKSIASLFVKRNSPDLLKAEWKKLNYGPYGLSLESPVALTKTPFPMPDEAKKVVALLDNYASDSSNKSFVVEVMCSKYIVDLPDNALRTSADASANQLHNQPGVTGFSYTDLKSIHDTVSGLIQVGNYVRLGIGSEFMQAVYQKGPFLCMVLIIWPADDEVAKKAAKRIVDSVKIEIPAT